MRGQNYIKLNWNSIKTEWRLRLAAASNLHSFRLNLFLTTTNHFPQKDCGGGPGAHGKTMQCEHFTRDAWLRISQSPVSVNNAVWGLLGLTTTGAPPTSASREEWECRQIAEISSGSQVRMLAVWVMWIINSEYDLLLSARSVYQRPHFILDTLEWQHFQPKCLRKLCADFSK